MAVATRVLKIWHHHCKIIFRHFAARSIRFLVLLAIGGLFIKVAEHINFIAHAVTFVSPCLQRTAFSRNTSLILSDRANISHFCGMGLVVMAVCGHRPSFNISRLMSRSKKLQLRATTPDATGGSGRKIFVQNESTAIARLPSGTAAMMDAFMEKNALDVCLQNLQKIEPKPGQPNVKHCYMEPNDIGISQFQMRLEVVVESRAGQCDVKILDMIPGAVNKSTGEVTFDESLRLDMEGQNSITWKQTADGGLLLTNYSKSSSSMSLPWWFPMPDAVVQKLIQFGMGQAITKGQKKVNEQVQLKFSDWKPSFVEPKV